MTGPTVVRPRKPAAPKVTRRKGPPKEVNPRSGRAGLRKVDTFMREAQVDEHGDLYVIRRPRSDQASPPPGTKRPTRKAA